MKVLGRLFLMVSVAACQDGNRCTPGQSTGCVCTNGDTGAQVCGSDGTFGACSCDSPGRTSGPRDGGDNSIVPPDLRQASGTGKRVFVTSASYSGNLAAAAGVSDGLAGGDKLCNSAAIGGGVGGTWKAWLSSSTVSAIDRIADVGPWYLTNGRLAFRNKAQLTTDPLTAIEVDEGGRLVGAGVWTGTEGVWTGTASGGQRASTTCVSWTSDSSTSFGTLGINYSPDSSWTDGSPPWSCETPFHLYCFEQ
jgi:hypothetical protein